MISRRAKKSACMAPKVVPNGLDHTRSYVFFQREPSMSGNEGKIVFFQGPLQEVGQS